MIQFGSEFESSSGTTEYRCLTENTFKNGLFGIDECTTVCKSKSILFGRCGKIRYICWVQKTRKMKTIHFCFRSVETWSKKVISGKSILELPSILLVFPVNDKTGKLETIHTLTEMIKKYAKTRHAFFDDVSNNYSQVLTTRLKIKLGRRNVM